MNAINSYSVTHSDGSRAYYSTLTEAMKDPDINALWGITCNGNWHSLRV